MLHPHHGQAEAVARITWLIGERAIGVVTGEVGAGKTVAARAATSAMDPVRHTIIYLANPLVGQRGIYAEIARTLGQTPRYLKAALVAQAAELLSAEHAEKAKTCLLLGQPTVRRRLKIGTLAALDQRVALRFNLDGMDLQETVSYVSTTSSSPAAATRCSATTPSAWSTRPAAASPEPSTTWRSRP